MRQTAPFADQLDALGIWWPRGDGDAMRAAAGAWTAIGEVLAEITDSLDDVQTSVSEGYRGPAADALRDLWAAWSGPDGHLPSTAADCRRLAAALTDFGGDIDAAHTTLVRLIETVLDAGGGVDGLVDGDDIEYLRTGADEVGAVLSKRASVRGRPLDDIAAVHSRTPADRSAIDTANVSWVDPGSPDDLTFLVGESVDFGAGEGAVAGLLPGLIAPIGGVGDGGNLPSTPGPWAGRPGGSPSGPSVACPTPEPPGARPGDLGDDARHLDDDPGDSSDGALDNAVDAATPITLESPIGAGIGGGGGGGGFGGGSGGGFSGGFDLGGAFDALPDGAALGAVPLAAGAAAIPISVARPPTPAPPSPMTSPSAMPASGSGSGSRMPFMPMMPMSGGGGEDGTEPKRRRVRKPRWPEPEPEPQSQ